MATVLCCIIYNFSCLDWPFNFSIILQILKNFLAGTNQLLPPLVDKLNLRLVCSNIWG